MQGCGHATTINVSHGGLRDRLGLDGDRAGRGIRSLRRTPFAGRPDAAPFAPDARNATVSLTPSIIEPPPSPEPLPEPLAGPAEALEGPEGEINRDTTTGHAAEHVFHEHEECEWEEDTKNASATSASRLYTATSSRPSGNSCFTTCIPSTWAPRSGSPNIITAAITPNSA